MSIIEEMVQRITELELRLDNLVQPAQAYHYQPIDIVKGWWPATDEASQTLNLQDGTWGLPAGIKAVALYIAYKAANADDYGRLEKSTGDGSLIEALCQVGNKYATGSGIVDCDSSGDIYFATNNATNTTWMNIHGYFI